MGKISVKVEDVISLAVSINSPLFLAQIVIFTPSLAKLKAMAFPMPRLDPVTIATLLLNPKSMLVGSLGDYND